MNTTDLINTVAAKTGLTKTDTKLTMAALFETLGDALKSHEDIRISGFGTFYAKLRPASEGRNPQTGAPIQISASLQAKFRAAKELKEKINP